MNPATNSLEISFLIATFLSGENHCRRCLIGFESGFKSNLCSANSLGTPGISAGFYTKISLFSLRKLVSASSYSLERWALMIAILEGSLVPRSISMVSVLQGGAMIPAFLVRISMSSGLVCCAMLAISYASLACLVLVVIWMDSVSQSYERLRSPRKESMPLGPDILSKRFG